MLWKPPVFHLLFLIPSSLLICASLMASPHSFVVLVVSVFVVVMVPFAAAAYSSCVYHVNIVCI